VYHLITIYVDADGCPVKNEVYRVAKRYGLKVYLVSNSRMRIPQEELFELVIVDEQFNAADDWIVEQVRDDDIVVSADIPLAARCLGKGARVTDPKGRVFTKESIGDALANRELMAYLRDMGNMTGGPDPFETIYNVGSNSLPKSFVRGQTLLPFPAFQFPRKRTCKT
jgi:uncharacterized protein YaiI (UPF0178 family)